MGKYCVQTITLFFISKKRVLKGGTRGAPTLNTKE